MRFTADEAFNHIWIQRQRRKEEQDIIINTDVIKNMRHYIDSINFKKTAMTLIASRIPEQDVFSLRQIFTTFDRNGDGRLTLNELKEGINKIDGANLTDAEIESAMRILDSNKNGMIDYTEFIAGCLQSYHYLNEKHLRVAFNYFDRDHSGTITYEELKQSL